MLLPPTVLPHVTSICTLLSAFS